MLVKQNLYVNPEFIASREELVIRDGKLIVEGFYGGFSGFLNEEYNLTIGKKYYLGFLGKVNGKLRLYKRQYLDITSKGNLHYIEFIYDENTKPLHMWCYNTDLEIELFFITDQVPDIVIPNEKDIKADNQAVYPAGGYSKRCIQSRLSGGGLC